MIDPDIFAYFHAWIDYLSDDVTLYIDEHGTVTAKEPWSSHDLLYVIGVCD